MGHAPMRIGDVEVAIACEGFASIPLDDELPDERVDWGAERAAPPWAFLDARSWAWHVHAFGLSTEAGVAMVDTGLGSFPPYRPWSEHTSPDAALARAGIDARDVRAVVLTHLHADHAGGTMLAGHPRFPNAVHHVHPADWSFFNEPGQIEGYTARRCPTSRARSGR
ncbi:MAG: MBL fold metallo-hydrolase [Actinomycetota bacterium]|nr:MBL fold metallo-hydrolase [Actinomycetota bacterium]